MNATPDTWVQIAQMLFTFLGVCVSSLAIYYMAKLNIKQDAVTVRQEAAAVKVAEVKEQQVIAAVKVEEVKETLMTATADSRKEILELRDVADRTHVLVNSSMGAALRLTASVSRTLANLTNDPVHRENARVADEAVRFHDAQQVKVDAKSAGKDRVQ